MRLISWDNELGGLAAFAITPTRGSRQPMAERHVVTVCQYGFFRRSQRTNPLKPMVSSETTALGHHNNIQYFQQLDPTQWGGCFCVPIQRTKWLLKASLQLQAKECLILDAYSTSP